MLALFLTTHTKRGRPKWHLIRLWILYFFFFHNAFCQNELCQSQIFFFTYTSGYTTKHYLNFMLVTELQRRQSNSIAKHLKTVFSHPQYLFVAGEDPVSGHLTLTP